MFNRYQNALDNIMYSIECGDEISQGSFELLQELINDHEDLTKAYNEMLWEYKLVSLSADRTDCVLDKTCELLERLSIMCINKKWNEIFMELLIWSIPPNKDEWKSWLYKTTLNGSNEENE